MRHRLLEAMAKRMPAFRVEAGGGAEIDECFFRESFKGNRSRSESGMPRKPRSTTQVTDGHEKIGVLTGINFFMRHRLLEAMAKRMPAFRVEAGGGAEIDECFFRESFKGNRSRSESGMPRKPRSTTQVTDGHEKIGVLTGINDAGDIFYEIAGRGGLDEAAARELLAD